MTRLVQRARRYFFLIVRLGRGEGLNIAQEREWGWEMGCILQNMALKQLFFVENNQQDIKKKPAHKGFPLGIGAIMEPNRLVGKLNDGSGSSGISGKAGPAAL